MARPQIASERPGNSESWQARDMIGMEEVLSAWLLVGHLCEDEEGKILDEEDSEHGSLLSSKT